MTTLANSLVALLAAATTTANADPFCPGLAHLMDQTSTTFTLPIPMPITTECRQARGLTGITSMHCAWPFDYRSAQAQQAFETLLQKLPTCFETPPLTTSDQQVNHPDSYDLRIFQFEAGEVGVSLKDKASLQQTYVFLRVQSTRP